MDLSKFRAKIVYLEDGKKVTTEGNDFISVSKVEFENGLLKAWVDAKKDVEMVSVSLLYDKTLKDDELFFINGYQSWSYSKEYAKNEVMKGLSWICDKWSYARKLTACYGDYDFTTYSKELFHSFTYTYFRDGDKFDLYGTLSDRNGYTIFYLDKVNNIFEIQKELEGVTLKGESLMFEIYNVCGDYDEVFDKYFEIYPAKKTNRVKHLAGYTSWYNYFQNIDEQTMFRDLKGMYEKCGDKAQIFQIDDGYESMVGDWLVTDPEKFPNGMRPLVDEIHKDGYLAGLWLAPFAAQFKAKVVEEHPDWFIYNKNGKMLYAGFAWMGFYALDIEKPEVREYIKKCFDNVFDNWNFDMVKLDFLYAACIIPRNGKSRGQLMCEAMDFLRECCRDKIILGCGAPLGPSWGIVDACRISCDAELQFTDKFYVSMTNREILSTQSSITNTIARRHLNGRIFANDPDVFFLRYDGYKPVKYTMEQRKLHSKVNRMFGDILFVSDDISAYDKEQLEILQKAYKPFEGKIKKITYKQATKTYVVEYVEDGNDKKLVFSMSSGEFTDFNNGSKA